MAAFTKAWCALRCKVSQPVAFRSRCFATEATVKLSDYHLHLLEKGPATSTKVTRDEGLKLYTQMASIRRFELMCGNFYRNRVIRGFLHLYVGQEAIAVGMTHGLDPNDVVVTAYRCHGWAYMLGEPAHNIFAELMGKVTGTCHGKGGSMHIYNKFFFGGNGIVGAQIPIGAGLAFALKYLEKPLVSVTLYGDGAANQGQAFEAYNIASLWKLPVIFVCENNGFAMGTSTARGAADSHYADRMSFIPGIRVDGMDVLTMREVARFARKFVLANGPLIVDAVTYRYFGHSMTDPGTTYRTREEVSEVRHKSDCLEGLKHKLVNAQLATEEELKAIDNKVKEEVEEAANKAERDPEPKEELAASDVYVDNLRPTARGMVPWESYPTKNFGTLIPR